MGIFVSRDPKMCSFVLTLKDPQDPWRNNFSIWVFLDSRIFAPTWLKFAGSAKSPILG
jgi:hypothetical protein